MDKFELRPLETGVELRGGKLEAPMVFREADAEQRAIHLVGFLSQRDGSILRILDAAGTVVATKEFGENPLSTSRRDSGLSLTNSPSGFLTFASARVGLCKRPQVTATQTRRRLPSRGSSAHDAKLLQQLLPKSQRDSRIVAAEHFPALFRFHRGELPDEIVDQARAQCSRRWRKTCRRC
jgi:hypothetical protein